MGTHSRKVSRLVSVLSVSVLILSIALPMAPAAAAGAATFQQKKAESLCGMKHYFGNLHSHTAFSDGKGTPEQAFKWARDTARFNFYVVSDHAELVNPTEWQKTGEQADSMNQDGRFVAMRGFEWSNPLLGHSCVYNTENYTTSLKTVVMRDFYKWVYDNGGVAQFNHPGREPLVFSNLKYMDDVLGYPMSTLETGNKEKGNNDGEFFKYYVQALDNGFRVAPTNGQDNHTLSAYSHRTAVIAPTLTRASILDAVENRRVYSTDDPNLKIVFKQGKNWMGSEIDQKAGKVQFNVLVQDDENISKLELLTTHGQVVAEKSFADGTNSKNVWWGPSVNVTECGYYFVRVTEKDTRNDDDAHSGIQVAVTSPIWINMAIENGEVPPGNWYKGDLHSHSTYSDGDTSVPGVIQIAENKGFDYFVLTDHYATGQWYDPGYQSPTMSLLYGVEWTTGKGHANIWSNLPFDWSAIKPTQSTGDAKSAIDITHGMQTPGQKMLFSMNHPNGFACQWLNSFEDSKNADCMEVWNARFLWPNLNNLTVLKTLDDYVKQGKRVRMVGGSDSHAHTTDPSDFINFIQALYHNIGNPTTWVYARSQSGVDILDALQKGHASISFESGGPQLQLWADPSYKDGQPVTYELMEGDSIPDSALGKRVRFQVRVVDAIGVLPSVLVVRKNGKALTGTLGQSDDFAFDFTDVPRKGDYYRVELHQITLDEAANPITNLLQLTQLGWIVALTNPIYTWTDLP